MKLIKFEADWCAPCGTLSQVMASIDLASFGVDLIRMDIDTPAGELSCRMADVSSVPTMILVSDGTIVDRAIGLKTKEWIEGWLSGHTQARAESEVVAK